MNDFIQHISGSCASNQEMVFEWISWAGPGNEAMDIAHSINLRACQ